MSGMLLALFASLIAGIGGRDSSALAGVAQRHGPRPGLLWAGVLVSCATAALAAFLLLPANWHVVSGAVVGGLAGMTAHALRHGGFDARP